MTRTLRPRAPQPESRPPRSHRSATLTALVAGVATAAAGLVAAPAAQAADAVEYVTNPTQYVNSFIGSQDEGNTYPGANVPFGMVQLSPDTGHNTGYDYTENQVRGFSTTHMSGVGCGLDGFVPILPTTSQPANTDYADSGYKRSFKKNGDGTKVEQASPGYYSTTLTSGTGVDINAELTATEHTGLQHYTFPASVTAGNVLINAGQSLSSVSSSSVKVVGSDTVLTTSTVSGFCQGTAPFTVYSVTKFSRPFASSKTWVDNTYSTSADASSTKRTGAFLQFDTSSTKDVTFQTAISYVDAEGAQANLDAETTTFDAAKAASHEIWNTQLSKVKVPLTSDDASPLTPYTTQLRTFYSALYRTFLAPNTGTDVDGRYRGWDAGVHDVDSEPGLGTYYQNFSLWDTYRTQQQVLALIEPKRSQDMAMSVVLQSEQGGWAPRWGYGPVETNIMTGDPVTPFLVSAWHQGLLTEAQAERAYTALKQNADEVPPASSVFNGRMGNPTYIADGYVAFNSGAAHKPGDFDLAHGGSATLEYALADATLSTLARDLGHTADAERYAQRGQNFRAIWDAENQTFRSRGADGLFVAETDPSQIDGFHEGTSLQYEWLAQQDIPGLIDLFGGVDATNDRLDDFFVYGPELLSNPNKIAKPATNSEGGWVTGAYSYYGTKTYNPNNEPDLHSPFVYLWTGQPWKTTDVVRAALTLFTDGPQGVTGNDDLGQMSSWAVASSLGIFPIMPGTDVWGLSTPVFTSIDITLDQSFYTGSNGHLIINAPGRTDANRYVQSLKVGGETVDRAYLTGTDLVNEGTLDYTVGSEPSAWATAADAAPGTIATAPAPTRVYVPNGTIQVAAKPGETIAGKIAAIVQGPSSTLSGTATVLGTDQITALGSGEWTADTKGGSVQLPISLKVADDAPPGLYPVTVEVKTADGVAASGTAVVSVGQTSWLAATGAFDNKAIGEPVAGSANFSNGEFLLRAGMAPGGIGAGVVLTAPTDRSLTYVLEDKGAESSPTDYDNLLAAGQTTDVTAGMAGATKIAFIGSVNNGPVAAGPVTLTYTDDSTQTIPDFGFTDWCSGSPQTAGNVLVGKSAQRWAGGVQNLACGLWATKSYTLTTGKSLKSITWPNTPKVHVFAIARDTAATVAPAITGTPAVDETLSAVPGAYPTSGYVESYQWLADGKEIAGATDASLTLTGDLAGKKISLTVTAKHPALTSVIVTTTPESAPVALGTYSVVTEPTLWGTAKVGETLTVTPGTYSKPDVIESYEWRADGAVIAGATDSTLQLGAAQLGKKISVTVSSSKAGYSPAESVTTAPTVPVVDSSIKVTRAPVVSGTPAVGNKLAGSPGSYSVAGVKVGYQWLRNGVAIKGATASTYMLSAADNGTAISVRVTASKAGYTTITTTSKATSKVKAGTIVVKKNVAITGSAKVGSTLKVKQGSYSPWPSKVTYRWLRNGVSIKGATWMSYELTAADEGKSISVRATLSTSGYTTVTTTSKATSKVKAGTITVKKKAAITGKAKVGSTLKVKHGSYSPSPTKATYRWLRNGVSIKGATSSTYRLTSADRSKKITVKVTVKKSGYTTTSYTTAKTQKVR